MAKCKACHRSIFWVRYPSGANAPINTLPTDDGIVKLDGVEDKVQLAHVTTKKERVELDRSVALYVPHHGTCEKWKRNR